MSTLAQWEQMTKEQQAKAETADLIEPGRYVGTVVDAKVGTSDIATFENGDINPYYGAQQARLTIALSVNGGTRNTFATVTPAYRETADGKTGFATRLAVSLAKALGMDVADFDAVLEAAKETSLQYRVVYSKDKSRNIVVGISR